MNRHTFRHVAVVIGVGASLALAACGDDADEAADSTAPAAAATTVADGDAPAAALTVDGAWARTSPMMASAGAAYMTLTSAGADAVVGASVDASVAGTVELHETKMADMGEMTGTTMEGGMTATTMEGMAPAMEMVPVDEIALPAGQAVALAPGGLHIMLLDLVAPLEVGTSIQITLELASGATQVVDVPVLDEAP